MSFSSDNKYLFIDPGETTGWALFNKDGKTINFGQIKGTEEFSDWLSQLDPFPDLVVYEEYRLFSHLAVQQSGSKMVTSQVVGIVKHECRRRKNVPCVAQPSSILPIAEIYAGWTLKSKGAHSKTNGYAAILHGIYFLQKNRIRPSRLEKEKKNESTTL